MIAEDLRLAIGVLPQIRQFALIAPELDWARQNLPALQELLSAG
jgi:hypothetical protein